MRRRAAAACAIGGAILTLAVSCREPTQITLVLTTDVDCATVQKAQTEILVGTRASVSDGTALSTSAASCSDKAIGSLTIIPGGDTTVAITVHQSTKQGKLSSACRTDAKDCITARRVIGFVPRTPLTLPIDLSLSCLDVPCGSNETCVSGKCVSDTVNPSLCKDGVCGPNTLVPPDAGSPDAGAADAGVDVLSDAGCSPNLLTDDKNCGACGLDCSGGTCAGGVCRLIQDPSDFAELGCLTVTSASGTEEVYWTRTKNKAGSYRVPAKGGIATAFILAGSGPFGAGISSNLDVIAFSSGAGPNTLLFECDPKKLPSACQPAADSFTSSATKWVATNPNTTFGSFALHSTKLFASKSSYSQATSAAIGPIAATNGYVAFQRKPVGGPELLYVDLATSIVTLTLSLTQGQANAMVGDPVAEGVFYASGSAVSRLSKNTGTPVFTSLAVMPTTLAIDPDATNLYWTGTETNNEGVFRGPSKGGTVTRIHGFAQPIQCLAAGKDALYWLSAGVVYKAHK